MPIIPAPIIMINTLIMVNSIFFRSWPQFRCIQNTPASPYVNQDANRELISERRLLKFGILSAITHANVHKTSRISTHDPIERNVFRDICFVPRNSRTYTYFAATWANITPAIRI
jgi:hypothetical protein